MHPPFLARRKQDVRAGIQNAILRGVVSQPEIAAGAYVSPMHLTGGNLTSGLTTGATYTVSSANVSNKYNAAQILGKQ